MKKAIRNDIVECFDHGATQDVRSPLALDHPRFDLGDDSIPKRIVVPGVDDRRRGRKIEE